MTTDTQVKIINEIKQITETAMAKKQDAARLNFPNIIAKIKRVAETGESFCKISTSEMNEYDRALLVTEGFSVQLIDRKRDNYESSLAQYIPQSDKEWVIKW